MFDGAFQLVRFFRSLGTPFGIRSLLIIPVFSFNVHPIICLHPTVGNAIVFSLQLLSPRIAILSCFLKLGFLTKENGLEEEKNIKQFPFLTEENIRTILIIKAEGRKNLTSSVDH